SSRSRGPAWLCRIESSTLRPADEKLVRRSVAGTCVHISVLKPDTKNCSLPPAIRWPGRRYHRQGGRFHPRRNRAAATLQPGDHTRGENPSRNVRRASRERETVLRDSTQRARQGHAARRSLYSRRRCESTTGRRSVWQLRRRPIRRAHTEMGQKRKPDCPPLAFLCDC